MTNTDNIAYPWMELAATAADGREIWRQFIKIGNQNTSELLHQYNGSFNVTRSICLFAGSNLNTPALMPLYFIVHQSDIEQLRERSLHICSYLGNYCKIPDNCIDILYDGGNEILISVAPLVFDGTQSKYIASINYQCSRAMCKEGIKDIDIDVYDRQHHTRLSNSKNSVTGKCGIPLSVDELLGLDGARILELASQSRPEDSMIMPYLRTQAAEWFGKVHKEIEAQHNRQEILLKALLNHGWDMPQCMQALERAGLYRPALLEFLRIKSQFMAWIKAHPDQIRSQLEPFTRRSEAVNSGKLASIISFAVENPGFVGCDHKMLQQFCFDQKCFIWKLQHDNESLSLFKT